MAADAPWLDILHPVEVGFLPTFGHNVETAIGLAIAGGLYGWLGECFCIDIPLVSQPRLNDLARTVAKWCLDDAVFHFFEQAHSIDRLNHHLACVGMFAFDAKAVKPDIFRWNQAIGCLHDAAFAIEHVEHVACLEPGAFADFKVVEIMARRDFHCARTQFGVSMFVRYNRDQTTRDG